MTATIVSAGQTASGVTLHPGDQLIVLPGGSATGLVNSGGTVIGTGTVILSGATLASASTATVTGAAIPSGGREIVLPGGVVAGISVTNGGEESVFSGGYSTATTVSGGGTQTVHSGGFAIGQSVAPGGAVAILAGGTASATTINGGTLTVTGSGALATSAVATSGATVFVQSGGEAAGLSASASTALVVQSGGRATGGSLAGTALVSSGGTIASAFIAGRATVLSGGAAVSVYVKGFLDIQAGATATAAFAEPGGLVTVFSGGLATDLVVGSTTRYGAGTAIISSGGTAIGTNTSATLIVDGGTTINTNATFRGFGGNSVEIVLNGGRASGTIGIQVVSNGGMAFDTQASVQNVASGGVAYRTIVADGGQQGVLSGGTASGTILAFEGYQNAYGLAALAVQTVYAGAVASGTIIGYGGMQVLQPGSTTSGTVLLSGGRIRLTSAPYFTAGHADFDPATMTLSVTEGIYARTLQLSGDYTNEYFHLSDDGAGGTFVTVDGTPCYCHGTLIQTPHGERPVETLEIGDRVTTASGQHRPIRWLGRRAYAPRFARNNPEILPVLIRAGALGDNLPRRDLRISPLHAMLLDGALVPAAALVNGTTITQPPNPISIEYVHIELDTHDIILAEGAPSETFLDDDSRAMFHNAPEYRTLYPDAAPTPPRYCAPRLEHGPALQSLRRRLAALARSAGVPPARPPQTPVFKDAPIPYCNSRNEHGAAGG